MCGWNVKILKISKISDIFKVEKLKISDIYRGYISSIYIMPTLTVIWACSAHLLGGVSVNTRLASSMACHALLLPSSSLFLSMPGSMSARGGWWPVVSPGQGWQVFARRWKKPGFSMEKTGPGKIVFAGKNRFLPEYIFLYFYYNKIPSLQNQTVVSLFLEHHYTLTATQLEIV